MIKAIETQYRGYRFRSRLEARWAVFFDALHIKWEYEPEGYEINGYKYLPDFHLTELGFWIEIKPTDPDKKAITKIETLEEELKVPCFLFYGQFKLPYDDDYPWAVPAYSGKMDWPYLWCECQDCGAMGIEFDGRSDRLPCKESYWSSVVNRGMRKVINIPAEYRIIKAGCPRHGANSDKGYNYDSPRLIDAYLAAMRARFEYGESGST